jgi:multicomponent Na+:H+ antiporter subunit D
MFSIHLPVIVLLIPLVTALIIPVIADRNSALLQFVVGSAMILATLLVAIALTGTLRGEIFTYYFGDWLPGLGIEFIINVFSGFMSLLVLFMATLILFYAFKDISHDLSEHLIPYYYTLIFLMLFAMIGMIYTNDLFNLYVFMEILSLTSCAIVSIKRTGKNLLASIKYLMQGTIGSVSILMGIAFIYMASGHLNISTIAETMPAIWAAHPQNVLIALGFMLTGFGIKAAVFPLHTWLPDAHSTAPTPSSALLSGLVVKIYLFAMMKVMFQVIGIDILREVGIQFFLVLFAVAGMIMGSVFAIGQKDLKRILAYSSVAQIGYIMLGIALASPSGLNAAFFHVVSHALMKGALFLSAGAIIYNTGKRNVDDFNGIGYRMPFSMTVFTIAAFGMIGIPGVSGFISKWYLSLAVLEGGHPWILLVILFSSFLNSMYYLPIVIKGFLCAECEGSPNVMGRDSLPASMWIPMAIMAFLIILFGLFPQLIMNITGQMPHLFL